MTIFISNNNLKFKGFISISLELHLQTTMFGFLFMLCDMNVEKLNEQRTICIERCTQNQ